MSEQLSQELSERLHDKGLRVESKSSWGIWEGQVPFLCETAKCTPVSKDFSLIPAPTFTELWERTPLNITGAKGIYMVKRVIPPRTMAAYKGIDGSQWSHKSPVESLGLVMCWLLTNGHMKGDV